MYAFLDIFQVVQWAGLEDNYDPWASCLTLNKDWVLC